MVLVRLLIFLIVPNIVWQWIVFLTILENETKRTTCSEMCGFVEVLARIIISVIFPNMIWEGIVFWTILEKVKPREKPYQEYVDLWLSCQRSSFSCFS